MSLRDDAITIWKAGVESVDSAAAVHRSVLVTGRRLCVAGVDLELAKHARIEVIGAGKAGAGMAAGIESTLLSALPEALLSGWVNVPADCVRSLRRIHLHAARPAGINEPTQAAVDGTEEILRRIRRLEPPDVCIVLLSGGASALLCSPVPQISLSDKLAVTRALAASGAPIQELNLVRTQLSQVKGGRLASACRAGTLVALIISDVIGDPLEVIGSGPTTISQPRPEEALQILSDRRLMNSVPASVVEYLREPLSNQRGQSPTSAVTNSIVASNRIALAASAATAEKLGYSVESLGSEIAGDTATHGRDLVERMLTEKRSSANKRLCILSGGEPTVNLSSPTVANSSGKGGRNQELVLAAIAAHPDSAAWSGLALLSGGTDGEDGPTDAAGAFADEAIVRNVQRHDLEPTEFLNRHDSWTFFNTVGGHLKTGPTHTNVMDLRVGLVSP